MFDSVFGLPLHPLVVHAAVVFTPLLAAVAVAYAVLPRFRARLDWALVLLAVAAPISVFVARMSGEALKESRYGGQAPAPVAEHESFALPLLLTSIALAVVALALVWAVSKGRGRTLTTVLSVLAVAGALAVTFYVVRAGHTGATAVWGLG
ncbi:hypothetical protein FDA94_33105 [Herbidospora galbida]|uniref:DUF2231 domain-containing protein n=1 Tax=Herbidospora galbida TaxID=2575442 RepID=A0A4U3M7X5_9ACTN|nr:DUF2231 domain-containing protein [Herbidospora galbida]TKK83586.1 hypothetical protein FDA94_33105 [Herbidospora galbida]